MIRVAICDDNVVMCDQICKYVSNVFSNIQIEFDISKYSRGSLLLRANENANFDILFLDIQMPEINGFDIAEKIKKRYPRIHIIFITSNTELVYKSFTYQPFYCLYNGVKTLAFRRNL